MRGNTYTHPHAAAAARVVRFSSMLWGDQFGFGGVLLLFCLGAGGWAWYERSTSSRGGQERARGEVTVRVRPDAECPREQPLELAIENTSSRTLKRVPYTIRVFEPGRSGDLVVGAEGFRMSDIIVAPRSTQLACIRMPNLTAPARAGVVVNVEAGQPEFYEPGEFVPR